MDNLKNYYYWLTVQKHHPTQPEYTKQVDYIVVVSSIRDKETNTRKLVLHLIHPKDQLNKKLIRKNTEKYLEKKDNHVEIITEEALDMFYEKYGSYYETIKMFIKQVLYDRNNNSDNFRFFCPRWKNIIPENINPTNIIDFF